ncbi:hypothetical protein Tco_1417157 [Tanacetum coccineum]
MAQIIQCLRGKTRGFDQITNKDAIILYSLANGVNIDYANIFWEDIVIKLNKKTREKVVPYCRFLSLLIQHKMKEQAYGDSDVKINPTQISLWCLNVPKPPPKLRKRIPKEKKTRAKTKSSKTQTRSKSKATKGGSSNVPTGSQSGHFKTMSSLALDTNPSQPSASTPVDVDMHKEDQQAIRGPTSIRVTGEEGAHPHLSSGMSSSNLNKLIFSASFIIHSEFASRRDASADSTVEADPGKYAPNDSIRQQQGMNEGTTNYSFDHIFAGTDPNVLVDKTQSINNGLKIVLTTPKMGNRANTIAKQIDEASLEGDEFTSYDEIFKEIKLEDLSKLVQKVKDDFIDLNSPEDDPIIVVDESKDDEEDKDEGIHANSNVETEDTLVPKPPSPRSIQLQELTNQVLLLQSSNHKLEQLKTSLKLRMEQYRTHTGYALWEVIMNGDAPAVASASAEGPIPPKITEQKLARKNELKAKSTLLLAILDEHLLKFHGIKEAKTLWEAIKARLGGNKESKKMQKIILKQQYENFATSRFEGLDKTYDRF